MDTFDPDRTVPFMPVRQVRREVPPTKNLMNKILPFLLIAVIGLSAAFFGGAWFLYRMYQTLPTLDQLENIEPPLSSKVMGKDGNLVYEFSIEKRSWVSLKKIPQHLINAVIGASTSNGSSARAS